MNNEQLWNSNPFLHHFLFDYVGHWVVTLALTFIVTLCLHLMKCDQWKELAVLQQQRGSEWSQCVRQRPRLTSSLDHVTLIVCNLSGLWDLCPLPSGLVCTWMRNKSKSKRGTFCLSAKTTVWLYYFFFIRAQNHSRHKYWHGSIRVPVDVLAESLQNEG